MDHLVSFESHSVNEEFLSLKNIKAEKKFRNDNKVLFDELKKLEKIILQHPIKKRDKKIIKKLADIQGELYINLRNFCRKGGELFKILEIDRVDSDFNQVYDDIKNDIFKVNPLESESKWQEFIASVKKGYREEMERWKLEREKELGSENISKRDATKMAKKLDKKSGSRVVRFSDFNI